MLRNDIIIQSVWKVICCTITFAMTKYDNQIKAMLASL